MSRFSRHGKRTMSMRAIQRPEPDLKLVIYAGSGGRCWYCGVKCPLAAGTLDHRVPVKRGGTTTVANLAWSCRDCNSAKGQHSLAEYRVQCGNRPFWGEPQDRSALNGGVSRTED